MPHSSQPRSVAASPWAGHISKAIALPAALVNGTIEEINSPPVINRGGGGGGGGG